MKDARLRERWKTAEVWYQVTGSESLKRSQERPLLKVPQLAVETPGPSEVHQEQLTSVASLNTHSRWCVLEMAKLGRYGCCP